LPLYKLFPLSSLTCCSFIHLSRSMDHFPMKVYLNALKLEILQSIYIVQLFPGVLASRRFAWPASNCWNVILGTQLGTMYSSMKPVTHDRTNYSFTFFILNSNI
jgi:hypothetical protein